MMTAFLTIGTRGSRLALAQAEMTRAALAKTHGCAPADIAIKTFVTTGDKIQDRSLIEAGGKGLFTKEIEDALLASEIDLAVHSAKDMPAVLPDGLALVACLPREDARDCLIGATRGSLTHGAVIGTSSPRRAAQMKRLRPDVTIVDFRGNVDTRLMKIARGDVQASLLALAGLKRIGLEAQATDILPLEAFPPALGQGIVVLECRADDAVTRVKLLAISHQASMTALTCERAFLSHLDGSCRTPIAGYAELIGDTLTFHGIILKPDGSAVFETHRKGTSDQAYAIGFDAAEELKSRAPLDFFVS